MLGEQHLPARQLAEIARVQQGMLDFVRRFAARLRIAAAGSRALRPFLEAILVRALTEPVKAELDAFGAWVHDENMGSTRTRALIAADIEPEYLEYASAHQLASLESCEHLLDLRPGAPYRIPVIGEAVRSIFLRKAPPEAFQCPEQPRRIIFFWNDGARASRGPELPALQPPYRLDSFRHGIPRRESDRSGLLFWRAWRFYLHRSDLPAPDRAWRAGARHPQIRGGARHFGLERDPRIARQLPGDEYAGRRRARWPRSAILPASCKSTFCSRKCKAGSRCQATFDASFKKPGCPQEETVCQ